MCNGQDESWRVDGGLETALLLHNLVRPQHPFGLSLGYKSPKWISKIGEAGPMSSNSGQLLTLFSPHNSD